MNNRTFGVEIECIGISQQQAREAITSAGFPCEIESYNHETRNHWKIVTDSTVRDEHGRAGIEVVSPVLRGPSGLTELRKVAAGLSAAGATANRSCGLHVHVGADDLNVDEIKMIIKRYASHENVIDTYMPVSRRMSRNSHLKSMVEWESYYSNRLAECRTLSDIRTAGWDRYYKVNLAAYVRQGTIEFRHHSGTVNPSKIENWVLFVLNFVQQSQARAGHRASRRRRGRVKTRDQGLLKIVKALYAYSDGGSSTPTVARLAAVSGYSPASIPACVSTIRRRWGLRITKKRMSNASNAYVASITYNQYIEIERQVERNANTQASVSSPVVTATDNVLEGLSASTISYFCERAADLSAA